MGANSKAWYLSKTFWVNMIAIVALIAQGQFGYVISVEAQASILAVINVVLRCVTKEEIAWSANE